MKTVRSLLLGALALAIALPDLADAQARRRTTRSRARRPAPRAAAAPPPPRYTAPTTAAALTADLGTILGGGNRGGGQWGAMVVSLTRGDTLFKFNADQALLPASTMKMYTAALALERFGPDYQFSTDVLRDGEIDASGTLNGNLYLRGDGDPSLAARYYGGKADAPMDALARLVASKGIKRVTGAVIGDATAFEERRIPEGWLSRYLQAGYAARVSALSINENLVAVAVYPGENGQPARVVTEPASTSIQLASTVRTRAGSGSSVAVSRDPRTEAITVRGWIGTRSVPRKYVYVIEDPARFTAGSLQAALQRAGVQVNGASSTGATPRGADRVAALVSRPLREIVSAMDRESINIFAELLFRNAARGPERDGVGSADRANTLLREFLAEKAKAPVAGISVKDGSGLSTLDFITPRSMIHLLDYAHDAPWSSAFHASLPVAGESETLRGRMRGTPAQGNLHAKTGTTNDVVSLGGYVTAVNGEILAFSFIFNGNNRWNARATMDAMGATLAGFVRD